MSVDILVASKDNGENRGFQSTLLLSSAVEAAPVSSVSLKATRISTDMSQVGALLFLSYNLCLSFNLPTFFILY